MRKQFIMVAVLIAALGCSKKEEKQVAQNVPPATTRATDDDAAVPIGRDDPAARERERLDEQWRQLESLRDAQAGTPQGPAAPAVQVTFAPGGTETLKGLDANAINNAPVVVPLKGDVAGPSVVKTQVYLDRAGFSVGALDGRWGRNTAIALFWFQRSRGVTATEPGALDEQTFRALAATAGGAPQAIVQRTLTDDDVKGPFIPIPEDVYDKAKLDCLCYESLREKLAERFHTTEDFLASLNPDADFAAVKVGDAVWVPNVREPIAQDRPDIARIVISIRGNTFNAFDAAGNLVFHSPTTLGSKYDPSPRETVEVKKVTFDPWFHYQPTLFHEVPDHEPEANLPPGSNSPVGVVWVALSKPHFGIHGTSDPESIGYASSHGCVRLTNWDAREVGHRVKPGVVVEFVDTRTQS
ncbi:MAG TPA: L,D-transpeptidase [Thermoanaerobaculia bacterium]|nr:L,D-transpeptidase [Thermoanaerobaculia bacterium]